MSLFLGNHLSICGILRSVVGVQGRADLVWPAARWEGSRGVGLAVVFFYGVRVEMSWLVRSD